MGLINWIFDFYQQSRIERLQEEAARARIEAAAIRTTSGSVDVERLERALGELALAVKAVQRIATEKGLCTTAELEQTIRSIDLEDGKADGRLPVR
jgi:hypothetical protein